MEPPPEPHRKTRAATTLMAANTSKNASAAHVPAPKKPLSKPTAPLTATPKTATPKTATPKTATPTVELTLVWSRAAARWFASPTDASCASIETLPSRPTWNRRSLTQMVKRAVQQTLATTPPDKSRGVRSISGAHREAEGRILSADISVVSDAEIHELNADYRGKNKPTDVLSFAFDDGEDFSAAFPGAPAPLGDIILSIETAARQAKERGHEIDEELAFLAVHGALHLLGYDHDVAARRTRMWAEQKRVMERLKPHLKLQ